MTQRVVGGASDSVRLAVRCKDGRMYGKKMKDLHIAGVRMLSDAVVRFRARDDKVAVADLLVGVGYTKEVKYAQQKIRQMKDTNNDKIDDLISLEVDYELLENEGLSIWLMNLDDVLKFLNRLGVRQVNDITADVTAVVTAAIDPGGMGAHVGAAVAAAAAASIDPGVGLVVCGKRAAREDALMNLEIDGRKTQLTADKLEIQERKLRLLHNFDSTMSLFDPGWKSDSRLMLQSTDYVKNVMFGCQSTGGGGGVLQLANGASDAQLDTATSGGGPALTASISVSQVAQELRLRLKHGDSVAIGKNVKKAYEQAHGVPPGKHRQWVDGAEREVNSYTEQDRAIIETAIRARMDVAPCATHDHLERT